MVGPDSNEGGIEDSEEREPPGDSVNDDGLGMDGGELVDEVRDRRCEEKTGVRPD